MKKVCLALAAAVFLGGAALSGCAQASTEDSGSTAPAVSDAEAADDGKEQTPAENGGKEESAETAEESGSVQESAYPVTVTIYDSQGKAYEETWEAAPERVVTTTTSAAELMIALGLEDKIVGIITPDNAVPENLQPYFDSFYNLGDKKVLSKEVVVSVEPDLVIGRVANFTEETSIDRYGELGILSYTQLTGNAAVSASPEMLMEDIRNLGKIFGIPERAEAYAAELEDRLEAVKEKTAELKTETPLRTLFMVAFSDGVFGVMDGALEDEIMAMIGCQDVADKGQSGLNYENLIQYNPDVIIYITADRNAASDETAVESLLSESLIQDIPAIANRKILTVKYDCIMDVGPRMIDTIEELAVGIYQS